MAMSPSQSPIMGPSNRVDPRADRHHSNSPPQQQLSKRDKRRSMLADRLEEITKQFSQNRDVHYREQLQAIQIDMSLIMEADAHGKEQLVNSGPEIDTLVQENMKKISMKSVGLIPPPRAGKVYAEFSKEVNDAMEERDTSLTLHKRDFDVKMSELAAADAYRKKLAALEHHALSSSLRDRLINSVTNKKNRLSRDRETIEIGESNALLLHPSQFGLANPASPGGMHSKRATRHRRDAEELPNFAEGNKRKRKAADSDESPAPTRQRIDNGSSTPLWFAEKNAMHATQVDSALYSIEKLFTEKELAMTYNQAALAAHRYMQRHQPYAEDIDTPPNGKSESGSEHEKTITAAGEMDLNDDGDSPPGGAEMARQFSHATRSTRGALVPNYITGLGIDALGDLNYPGNMEALTKQIPKMPPFLASVMQKGYVKGDAANQPAGLSADEAAAELDIIRRGRSYNDTAGFGRNLELDNGGKPLLEAVATPKRYDYWVKSDNRGMLDSKGFLTSNLREELVAGGEPMSKQSSRGVSEMGGTPMSRQNTGEGGTSSRGRRLKPIAGMA